MELFQFLLFLTVAIVPVLVMFCLVQAVYTVLREAEDRSVAPIPVWELPIWKDISPKLKKVNAALKLINDTLDDLIAICKVMFIGFRNHPDLLLISRTKSF